VETLDRPSTWLTSSPALHPEHVINDNGMAALPLNSFCSPNAINYRDAAEVFDQQAHASAASGVDSTTCPPPLKVGPLSTSRRQKSKKSQQLKCVLDDCTHEGTFSGNYELERHVKVKHHVGARTFACCAEGCLNKQLQLPWTFTRSDKLTAHIKAIHNRETVFTECPIKGCDFGKGTLETLGVHIARVHETSGLLRRHARDVGEARAVLNASSCKVRKCPLWRCGKPVKARELPDHIAEHATDDVLTATTILAHEGLVVLPVPSSSQQGVAQFGLVINVPCPICNTTSGDVDQFVTHFWIKHLFLSGGADHFISWKSTLIHCTSKPVDGDIKNLQPWANLRYWRPSRRDARTVACRSCPLPFGDLGVSSWNPTKIQQAARIAASAHHLSMLRPEAEVVAELYPHRMQILRLYPEFVSHPVFADFDQPQAGIAPSSYKPSQFNGTSIMEGVENRGQAIDYNAPF
jgi:hypothetical protein